MAILRSPLKAFLSCFPSLIPQKPMALSKFHFIYLLQRSYCSIPSCHLSCSLDNGELPFDWNRVLYLTNFQKRIPFRPLQLSTNLLNMCSLQDSWTHYLFQHNVSNRRALATFRSPTRFSKRVLLQITIDSYSAWPCLKFRVQTTNNLVLLVVSIAFDSVPHQRLLLKLASYGIRGHTLTWIEFS